MVAIKLRDIKISDKTKAKLDTLKGKQSYNSIITELVYDNDMLELNRLLFKVIDRRYSWNYVDELKEFKEAVDRIIKREEAHLAGFSKDVIV